MKYWVIKALIAMALCEAMTLTVLAQDSDDQVTRYDAGYASQAAMKCPGVTLTVKTSIATEAARDFTSGTAMFDMLIRKTSLEAACKSALNLYDAKTGKVAKVLAHN